MPKGKMGEISRTAYGCTVRVKFDLSTKVEHAAEGSKVIMYKCYPEAEGNVPAVVSQLCNFYKGFKVRPEELLNKIFKAMEE